MSKGLEEIRQYKQVTCQHCQYHYGGECNNKDECFSMIIEKELKQAEKDKEILDIFKNALNIEHDLSTPSFTPLEKDKPFDVNAIITETIKIKQNELDEKLRKSLREWVLKNAFPEELKRLEELEKAFVTLSKDYEKTMKLLSKEIEKNRVLKIIKKYFDIEYFQDFITINGRIPNFKEEEYNLIKEWFEK